MNKKAIKIKKKAILVINTNILTKKKGGLLGTRGTVPWSYWGGGLWWRVRDLINMVAATELQSGAEGREWKKEKETCNLGIREKERKWYLRINENEGIWLVNGFCVCEKKPSWFVALIRSLLRMNDFRELLLFWVLGFWFFAFFFWHKT